MPKRDIVRLTEAPPPNAPVIDLKDVNQLEKNRLGRSMLTVNARLLSEALINVYPWIQDTDVVAIEQYCRAEARARLLSDYVLDICDSEGPQAVPIGIWKSASDADTIALRLATSLGLTPEGRLRIAKDAGVAKHFAGSQLRDLANQGAAMRRKA